MRGVRATKRLIGSLAFLAAAGWASHAQAQLGVGTTWLRTDAVGKGITMTVEACCNGGLRLVYHIPSMGNQPAATMSVDSPMGPQMSATFNATVSPYNKTMTVESVSNVAGKVEKLTETWVRK